MRNFMCFGVIYPIYIPIYIYMYIVYKVNLTCVNVIMYSKLDYY